MGKEGKFTGEFWERFFFFTLPKTYKAQSLFIVVTFYLTVTAGYYTCHFGSAKESAEKYADMMRIFGGKTKGNTTELNLEIPYLEISGYIQ